MRNKNCDKTRTKNNWKVVESALESSDAVLSHHHIWSFFEVFVSFQSWIKLDKNAYDPRQVEGGENVSLRGRKRVDFQENLPGKTKAF